MTALFRTILTIITAIVVTFVLGIIVIVAALIGVRDKEGGIYRRYPYLWSRAVLWASDVKVRLHGAENLEGAAPCIFTCNHVSLFDIPALVASLPRHYFVAKAELFRIPIFGPGIRAIGTIPIERDNRKAAFGAYDVAATRIREGSSVVVFPEGTRGRSYPIRPFKKGPFVLAAKAGVPVVPCIVHGTIEILPKKAVLIRSGTVDLHVLPAVSTAGMTYEDRDELADRVHERMTNAMNELYLNQSR